MDFAATRIWCVFPVSGLATRRRAAGSSPGPRPIDRESHVQAAGFASLASAATGSAASAPCPHNHALSSSTASMP